LMMDFLVIFSNSEPFQISFQYNGSRDICQVVVLNRITIELGGEDGILSLRGDSVLCCR